MELIARYFPDLTEQQTAQFAALEPLYADWNSKINVISRKDFENFYEHHVLHSLAIAKYVQFAPGSRIVDVGTGGGFPGVPLAILFPDCEFVLVDSVGKKLQVINAVAEQIGLQNVTTVHERIENITGTFDFATSRAVTRLNEAWGWVSPKIAHEQKNAVNNGLLYLKGGDISAELPKNTQVATLDIATIFTEPYFFEKALVHIYANNA